MGNIFHLIIVYTRGFILRLTIIGPLHDLVTWYKIRRAGWQMAQWDIKDKEFSGIQMLILSFFDVPLRHLPSSSTDFIPRDQVMQRAY